MSSPGEPDDPLVAARSALLGLEAAVAENDVPQLGAWVAADVVVDSGRRTSLADVADELGVDLDDL